MKCALLVSCIYLLVNLLGNLHRRTAGRLDPLKEKLSCAHLKTESKTLLLCCADYECKPHGDPRGYCAPKALLSIGH